MKKNNLYLFFIVFFMAVCVLLSGGSFFLESKPRANEILSPKPLLKTVEGNLNQNYLKELTDYTGDHFALRPELITMHNHILSNVFHTSLSDDVILGKQGWLFYKRTEDNYYGRNLISDEDINNIAHTIKMMQQYVESQNAQFLFFIAPNKNSLYGQYMPHQQKLSEQSNAKKLLEALKNENVNTIDFFELFGQQQQILYHKLDSHWNNKGAALASDTILKELNVFYESWYDMEYDIQQSHKGDLYEMLYPSGKKLDEQIIFHKQFNFVPDNEIHAPDDIQIDTTNTQKEHSLLMFRDSFGNALYPFLADNFGHSRFSRKVPYPLTMMEEVNADVVIVEIVERNIGNLAQYAPIFPSPLVEWTETEQLQQIEAANVTIENSGLEGYSCIKGEINQKGKIYIQWQNAIYEAVPTVESFTAYVPEGIEQDLQAIFVENNKN